MMCLGMSGYDVGHTFPCVLAYLVSARTPDGFLSKESVVLLGWDSMASKLRRVSWGSHKGNGFKVDDLFKKIGGTVRSLYDKLVASFSKVLRREVAVKEEKVPEDARVKDRTSSFTGLGYEAVSIGHNVVYINLGTDEDIFNDEPVFRRIQSVSKDESESRTLLVTPKMTFAGGLPVEPLEDSSDAESDMFSTVYVNNGVAVATSSSVEGVQSTVSTVDDNPTVSEAVMKQAPAGNQEPDGIVVPELRRVKAETEPIVPVVVSEVVTIDDYSEVIPLFNPELKLDKDDVSVEPDSPDFPDDGTEALIHERKVEASVVIEPEAPVTVDVAVEAPKVVEPLVEGECESGITVAFPFESADVDVSEGIVFMDSFTMPEVFREIVIVPVIEEAPVVIEAPSVIVDASVVVQPDAVDDQSSDFVTFSFGAQGSTDGCMVRFMF